MYGPLAEIKPGPKLRLIYKPDQNLIINEKENKTHS